MTRTTAQELLDGYSYSGLTFDEVLAAFEVIPMARPQHIVNPAKTWGEVYRRAEEGDDTDVPAAVSAAKYAGAITDEQAEQLLAIYRRRVAGWPADPKQ